MSEKKFFLITSIGRTATYWLAAQLHNLPNVICNHGPTIVPPPSIYEAQPPEERRSEAAKQMTNFFTLNIDQYFNHLKQYDEAKFYGSVHAFTLERLDILNQQQTQHTFQLANIIRHPVPRMESFFRRRLHKPVSDLNRRNAMLQHCETAEKEYPECFEFLNTLEGFNPSTYAHRLFASTITLLDATTKELSFPAKHFRMEDLISNKEALHSLIQHITQNELSFTDTISFKKMNHERSKEISPAQQFNAWKPWQQEF